MKWKCFTLATAVLLSVATTSAFAGFSVVKPPPPASPLGTAGASPSSTNPGLGLIATRFIGAPDESMPIEFRYGFGREVGLGDALKQIAPAGWHAQLKENMLRTFDRQKKVNWRGGRSWVAVLDILAGEQGFSVDVDWNQKRLFIGEPLPLLSRSTGAPVPAAPMRHVAVVPAKPIPPPDPVWRAVAGSTLRATVAAWAKQAGWVVRWEGSVDYPIVAPLEFRGTYVQAITQLIQAYAHADRPLHAALYTDQRLIRVTENQ